VSGKVRWGVVHRWSSLTWRRWSQGWQRRSGSGGSSSGWQRPPGESAARGGKGKSEGQPDWRREVHGGELTKAVAMAVMAASKPATPVCLRWPVRTRCKGGLGGGRARSGWGRKGARRKRGDGECFVPF
jgi:hypothetical protein